MPRNNHLIFPASLALAALGVGFFARGIVGFVGSTGVISPVAVDRWGATVALAVALTFP